MIAQRKWMLLGAVLVGSVLGLANCKSDGDSSGSSYACDVEDSGFVSCFDYTGSAYTKSVAETACDSTTSGSATGTFRTSRCASTDRVGSCEVYSDQVTEQVMRFYDGYNDTTAAAACTGLSGSYTSG
jgi:hypothetical protein